MRLLRQAVEPQKKDLSARLRAGLVLPVVGAPVSYGQVFAANQGGLAKSWATKLDLPHDECELVCRVARYQSYRSGDDLQVKEGYLLFLKETLLNQARDEGVDQETVEESAAQLDDVAFTQFAGRLGYPKRDAPHRDPLLLLADLPLPIYVTTSFHGLLQYALHRAGKEPRTAVFCWNDAAANLVRPEHRFDPDHQPSVKSPLVFHVYGYDEYPESLVLSEDDYLSFLKSIAQEPGIGAQDRVIPVLLD